jgi:hypothetical protein
MKAILEFNLPEDQEQFEDASNGWKWSLLVWELDQHLRNETKYEPDSTPPEKYQAYCDLRDKLHEMLNNHSLELR